ncbi:MAG: outer membrane beta-barrel protein [Gemmatimonadales bacterium]
MRRHLILTLALLGAAAGTLAAQQRAELSLGGGITVPTGDFGNAAKTGWHALGTITWFPAGDPFGVQATALFAQNKFEGGGGKFQMFAALLEGRLDLRTEGAFRPYVMAGGGVTDVEAKPTSGSSTTRTKIAIDGGVGVAYVGTSKVGFFVQARYVNVFDSGPDLAFAPVTAGIRIALK